MLDEFDTLMMDDPEGVLLGAGVDAYGDVRGETSEESCDAPDYERLANKICRATSAYLENIHAHEVVIGLSGGIDSALVAALAVRALGEERAHGVLMPGPYSSESSVTDALECARRQGIQTQTIAIDDVYQSFVSTLDNRIDAQTPEGIIALQNIQARCRMVVLMALSNAQGWIVLNTGNKTEAYLGYSTMYGDMVGAFAPIGGLLKRDVYGLSRWLNEEARKAGQIEPIPESILVKSPSAELWTEQTDEGSIGVSYQVIDEILDAYEKQAACPEDLIEQGYAPEEVTRVFRLIEVNAWKRRYEPPSPA